MSTSQNQLRYEKSPYLLQHKDNPVHWYAWGDEAFSAAREQNKPIFLSIGYSTCHWCHVMEHESFEKEEVAEILNRHFISIKLDREERPDIDEIYMAAVQAMRQRGGWPLSVFLTPELKPFYAGTYFPKAHFMQLLHHLAQLWEKEQGQIQESAESITDFLRQQKSQSLSPIALSPSVLIEFYQNSLLNYDPRWGGFGSAPKFPHAMQISLLMRIYQKTGEARALEMVQHSLDQMARGGIYDHLGFGFARYSTDEKWLVPHFEKMLYDNALLVVSYLEAFQLTQEPSFRQVGQECLDYVLRVMTHPEGGFYSAEDADSEGEEGKFYVWTQAELQQILSVEEFSELAKVYGVSAEGNFEHHRNIFNLQPGFDASVKESPLIKSAFQKLFELREKRIHPHLDDKILTSWNGLMIRAMALGYQVLKDERYLKAAHRAADFIRAHLDTPQGLLARYRDGESRYAARLEDYAYLVEALIELYQCDFDPEILGWAWRLQEHQEQKFWDEVSGAYFFTDGKDESVLLRSQEGMDGALPNANGVSALNLLKFSALLAKPELKTKAEKIFQRYSKLIVEYPQAFSQMLLAYDFYSAEIQEIAIMRGKTGDEDLFLSQLRERFHSHHVVASGKEGDSFPALLEKRKTESNITTYYICRHQSCEKPTTSAAVALSLIV